MKDCVSLPSHRCLSDVVLQFFVVAFNAGIFNKIRIAS